ncbi:glycosyltransferase, partial [Pseudolysinimonas sp.]|uniref:glycosyltransferase n=1 Tax=Pseudolysinimonas sp. TaxID=2680009 RepID=UPI00286D2E3A
MAARPPAIDSLRGAPGRKKLSVIVTTFNEEINVAECLESVLWADEIVLVDSFSTDRTVTIAQRFPVTIL